MAKIHITITGTGFRYGSDYFEKGMIVKLIKEPDNKYDKEAIRVEMKPFGKIGYVANSVVELSARDPKLVQTNWFKNVQNRVYERTVDNLEQYNFSYHATDNCQAHEP